MIGVTLAGLAASPATAAVFDPGTGTGFVQRSEAQNAFGVDNADFFTYANAAVFRHRIQTSYRCPGGGRSSTREVVFVNDKLVTEDSVITGFDLTGYGGDGTRHAGSDCGGTVRKTTDTLTIDVPATLRSRASTVLWTP